MKKKDLSKIWRSLDILSIIFIVVGIPMFITGALIQQYYFVYYGITSTLLGASLYTTTNGDAFELSNQRYSLLAFYLVLLAIFHLPVTITTPDTTLQPHTTYITYSDKCPYCEISKSSMTRAVRTFNLTHKNVKIVNVSSDTQLAKELNKYIQSQGVILKTQKKPTQFNQVTYPLMDAEGKPKEASSEYIYKLLVEYSKK